MTSVELGHPSLTERIAALVQRATRRFDEGSASPESEEDARARRAFVQEMLSRNPQAFSSDLDVQSMMLHYPERF